MRGVLRVLIALWLVGGGGIAHAGGPDAWERIVPPIFSPLTQGDGLPYPVVMSVAQDGEGFIWLGTPGGIARWDGYRMTVFRHDDQDPNSLPENIVTNLAVDESGRLWLSTASGVVARYNDAVRGFVSYRDHGSGFGRLFGMASDRKGGIWVAGRRGLARLDVGAGVWRLQDQLEGIPPGEVGSVLIDRWGRVWGGTVNGVVRRKSGERSFEPITMPAELKGDMVTALSEARDGTLWFGTQRGAVGVIEPEAGQARVEPALKSSGFRVTAIVEIQPGVMWIGEYGGGVREIRAETGRVRHFSHDPVVRSSLGDNTVMGMVVDRSGLVWVASLGGIHRHIPANRGVITMGPGSGGLSEPDIRSVAAAGDGKVWVGYRSRGAALIDPAANMVATISPASGLPADTVQAIAASPDGTVWLGLPSGLYGVDAAKGRAASVTALANANIRGLLHDGTGLWAAGSMGVAHLASPDAPPRIYRSVRDQPASLSDDSGQVLFRDRAKRLWVGTQRGLNLLEDSERGRFRRFLNEPGNLDSLPSDIVNGLAEDRSGRLWVATANGIGVLASGQQSPAKFLRLGAARGLPNDTVLSVLEGPDGMMVAGTGGGLVVIDPETLAVRTLGPAEGAQIGTFWAGSGTRLSDGTLVLGGFGGMTVVRPGIPPAWEYRAPVVVTEMRVGDKEVPRTGQLVIGPESHGFQVEFTALDFSAPERNRYAYRLIGADDDWISADPHHRLAAYSNLPPGTYRLELRGSNSAQTWNPQTRDVEIHVLPVWYQTAWVRALGGLAGLAGLLAIIHGRKAYYIRRERELSRQVAVKTTEALGAQEEAEAANLAKSRFLAIIGHEIRTPLNGLLGNLQLLDASAFGAEPRRLLKTAKEAGDTLRTLVESILDYGGEGAERSGIVLGDTDLSKLVREAMELVRPQAEAKGLTLRLEMEPRGSLRVRCDRIKIFRILSNLLGNSVKFTERGGIEVRLSVISHGEADSRMLAVTVQDTGIGIADHMKEAIFGDFVQADDSIRRKYGGIGLGLAISRRAAIQIGGSLTVESHVGQGSIFRLEVPVTPAIEASGAIAPRINGPSLRVLVVDDDELNRRVSERLLVHLGHQVTVAAGGEEALNAVAAEPFDLILMDIWMPGMDGFEVARRIRVRTAGHPERIRILAMSADITDETRRQCAEAGMDGGLRKPVLLGILRDTLATIPVLAATDAPLDAEFLATQLDILGPEEMIRLTRMFQRVSRSLIQAMDAAVMAEDRPTIAALAHRLRSAAGPVGLVEVAECGARIQADAPEASLGDLGARIDGLRHVRLAGLKALGRFARMPATGDRC